MPGEEMTPEELEALAREMEDRAFDARVIAELERAPDVSGLIPADFAARVAAKVPARRAVLGVPSVSIRQTHYGWKAMWVCLAVLCVALIVLAAKGLGHTAIGTAVEWTLYAQFLAIVIWLGARRWSANWS
jgi:hypothetical protein